jgi:hypothetical protein
LQSLETIGHFVRRRSQPNTRQAGDQSRHTDHQQRDDDYDDEQLDQRKSRGSSARPLTPTLSPPPP